MKTLTDEELRLINGGKKKTNPAITWSAKILTKIAIVAYS
ncbi:bacteriocin [Mammaliicoccus stepanovicii]|uniref:Bacteriocin n=1 Tax=Mammaliicoccus stepanovicii TaxID=643214 RepID=A0A239YHW8_9STAP|nr:bacteriocin [Mammaliicoccus stepanovicii]GGI40723.1 hypothetical protein GCM10010896_09790 [Mammaliicoccus stepanovicii]SNV57828.1 Uncharacterised protein [Mammaliicoccus stepanovicii]